MLKSQQVAARVSNLKEDVMFLTEVSQEQCRVGEKTGLCVGRGNLVNNKLFREISRR